MRGSAHRSANFVRVDHGRSRAELFAGGQQVLGAAGTIALFSIPERHDRQALGVLAECILESPEVGAIPDAVLVLPFQPRGQFDLSIRFQYASTQCGPLSATDSLTKFRGGMTRRTSVGIPRSAQASVRQRRDELRERR